MAGAPLASATCSLERAERGAGITVRTLRAIAQALETAGSRVLQNQNGLGVRQRRR
jgi:hypothetical protein